MSDQSRDFVRPLGFFETLFASLHEYGCSQVVYSLILKSEMEIPVLMVKKSLMQLQRRFPLLQLTITDSDGVKYFKKMKDLTIDFEVLKEDNWKVVCESEMSAESILDPSVCLWRCKYLTMPETNADTTNYSPFTSALIFRIHHSITDGTTNMNFLNTFHKILDANLAGKDLEFNDNIEISAPADELLPFDFQWNDVIKCFWKFWEELFPYHSPFFEKFSPPKDFGTCQTKSIMLELTKEETSLLLQNCRLNKCTINGALTAAGAIAMNKMLSKKIGKEISSVFQVEHDVNLRKYAKQNNYHGVMIGYHFQHLKVTNEGDIWDVAKLSSNDLKECIKDETILQSARVLYQISGLIDRLFAHEFKHKDFKVRSDFGTSNMGDVSRLFPGVGEHVSVERLSRSTAWHLEGSPWNHCVTTFRGKLLYNLDYSLNCITDDLAHEYATTTFDILKRRCIYETNIRDDHF